ncbi:MAG TPA: DUF2461 domain-containing protein [Gemmatimonadaceae bacterium]|nr:DUF2461 domain-containing protein [Gemmatimonadaceae bacterium]
MSDFKGFSRKALTFLRQLKRNNQRDWFEENKPSYVADVQDVMRAFVQEMDTRFGRFAPEIVGDQKKSIFRIYRDVRFSKDKSPYKTHAACWFFHRGAGKKVGQEAHEGGAGFYFHLEPGASFVGAGIWMPPRPSLQKLRDAIVTDYKGFRAIVDHRNMKRTFGGLSDEGRLMRVPRGYDPNHAAGDMLRHVSYIVGRRLSDADVLDARLAQRLEKDFGVALPLVRWLNRALGYRPADSR